jgi:hypothetical protein
VYVFARAGVSDLQALPSFAPPTERTLGNNLPPWTGSPGDTPDRPGPHPVTQQLGGNLGNYDGFSGSDPHVAKVQPYPTSQQQLHHGPEQETCFRWGVTGFNDQRQIRDRHVYWARGTQITGISPSVPGNPPNNHSDGPAQPNLRSVNISINPQIGSDNTRFQDDLTRPYTWLGQYDGSIQPVYGGVPGLYQPYGTRGGMPIPIVDPSDGAGGQEMVVSGPPHGLHSDTMPSGKQIADRYAATPQMQPARIDRPSNSTAAGQSYSQTVEFQGGSPTAAAAGQAMHGGERPGLGFQVRGWAGT